MEVKEGEAMVVQEEVKEGECIRNPQFMWMSCVHACNSLKYADAEADCAGWARMGECEKVSEERRG